MTRSRWLLLGLPLLLIGILVAVLPDRQLLLPDWLGWILLLPGSIFTGIAVPRKLLEPLAVQLSIDGAAMLCQPWSIRLYGYSMAVLLLAVIWFTIASRLREVPYEHSSHLEKWRSRIAIFFTVGLLLILSPLGGSASEPPTSFYFGCLFMALSTIAYPWLSALRTDALSRITVSP